MSRLCGIRPQKIDFRPFSEKGSPVGLAKLRPGTTISRDPGLGTLVFDDLGTASPVDS